MWAAFVVLGVIAFAAVYAWSSLGLGAPTTDTTGGNAGDYTEGDVTQSATAGASPSPQCLAIAQAIAAAEGFGIPGTVPTRANNPGDLCLGDLGNGVITSSGGEQITVFPDAATGWSYLYNQVNLMINNQSSNYNTSMTWAQIGAKYAGPNTPWGANVAAQLGVDVNSTLGSYLNA